MSAELTTPPLEIYFDGNCQFCRWSRETVLKWDLNRRLNFHDFNQPQSPQTPFSLEELRREMHVLSADGEWHNGYSGWIAVLKALPGLHGWAKLMELPPFLWLGPPAYRFIAKHRYQIPQFVFRAIGAPAPCTDVCSVSGNPRLSGK